MSNAKIEDLLKQVLQKRSANKADEAVKSLGKLARRHGKNREPALEALKQAALTCPHGWVKSGAFLELGDSIRPEDRTCIEFLQENFRDEEWSYFCGSGLLRLKGQAFYPDLIEIIANSKCSLETRSMLLELLSDHSKRPFDKAVIAVDVDDLREEQIPVAELKAWQAAGFPDPEPIQLPLKELAKLGITLPDDYAKFLAEHFGEDYERDDETWRLSTADELVETIDVDGQDVLAIRQLSVFAQTLEDVMEDGETEDHKGKAYPLSRLADGVAIGTNGNGDVLYLDPADQSAVWVFHPDGGDVERVSKTFKAWLRQAETM
jgi:hypothetical protein